MNDKQRIKRRVYTHNHLLAVASSLNKQAQVDDEFDNSMASILFCALAVEANLNYVGCQLFDIWQEHIERKLTPNGKLMLISKKSKLEINFGIRPFQAFGVMFEFRNQIAHGKMQDISYDAAKQLVAYGESKWPATQWEPLCTYSISTKILEDAKKIIDIVHCSSGVERIPAFLLSEHVSG
jgi:hypothetical protein